MATEPGPFEDTGNPKEIQTQDFGSLVLRVEKVGVTAPTVKPDPFAVYQVSLRINVADPPILNGLHWDIWRRFSEFAELHAEFGKPKLQVKFPPKTLWRKLSGEFLEERRQLLDQYLQALAGEPDRRNNESFREFIYPRKPVEGEQPALAGDRTTEDTNPAPVAKKSGDESLKPGSSGAQGHTPMSSAAAAVSVSDNAEASYLAPGPISPFDPATPSSTKSQKEPPDPTCTNMSTLPPPSRLNFPRAPVIHASVCSSMRNCWQVGTAVDVYSNSTKSWRPGRVFAIGKTSGYPRSAQEDALTICYGDNRRSRKILPRSSLELRAARQDFLDDQSEEMDEKVNPEPASMADTSTWSETVKAAREVLSQVNALEDQSRTPPSETETRTSAFQVGERVRFLDAQSPRDERVHEGILVRNIGDVWRIAWATDSNKSKWVEEENISKLRDTKNTLMLEGRTEGQRPQPALPKVTQQPGAAGNIPENMAKAMDNPQPEEDTTHPLLTSKDTATERRTPKPTQAPAPTKRPSAPTKRASSPIVAPAPREDNSRRKSKPKWMRWFSKKDESNTTANSSKKNPSTPQLRTDQDLERKSQERATPSETFTVTNQLESLPVVSAPNTPKGAKSSTKETATDGKIQVLDKLRVEIPGRAKQRKAGKAKTKKKKKQRRLDAHSDIDEPLPDRLPPDHTVNVLDPNTQRRLSRIRHHLVIKARRHSPA